MNEEEQQVLFSNRNLFMMFLSYQLIGKPFAGTTWSDAFDDLAGISFTQELRRYVDLFGRSPPRPTSNRDAKFWVKQAWRRGFIEVAVEAKVYLDQLMGLPP
jgi:hypothetical protein